MNDYGSMKYWDYRYTRLAEKIESGTKKSMNGIWIMRPCMITWMRRCLLSPGFWRLDVGLQVLRE